MPHRTHPLALFAASVLVLPAAAHAQEPVAWGPDLDFHTFSIAAIDPRTGESGVAVTTRRPCVGNAVPWVRSGIGAAGSRCARARPSRFRGTLWWARRWSIAWRLRSSPRAQVRGSILCASEVTRGVLLLLEAW